MISCRCVLLALNSCRYHRAKTPHLYTDVFKLIYVFTNPSRRGDFALSQQHIWMCCFCIEATAFAECLCVLLELTAWYSADFSPFYE